MKNSAGAVIVGLNSRAKTFQRGAILIRGRTQVSVSHSIKLAAQGTSSEMSY